MMFKPFFVHLRKEYVTPQNKNCPQACTIWVRPDPDNKQHCLVSGTWCNPKDQFVKRIGRDQACIAEARSINKRDLPTLLNSMWTILHGYEYSRARVYYYLWKYML